ncbi:MAG: hypothetical protein ABW252_04190 [Polyangiales bacterium]
MGRLGGPRIARAARSCALLCALSVACMPPRARADAVDAALASEYDRTIDRALDEHERGHFQEAREHFRRAHELMPSARTLRGLGKVEFELRNYGEAVQRLSAALASDVKPLGPDLREEVEHLLERARAYVGEVHVAVQPHTASVSVDGVTVASGPTAALALLVGDHILEFRASGRLPERRHIHVRGGEQVTVQVVLAAPELHAAAPASFAGERRPSATPAYKKWWVWTLTGVALAGVATGIAVAATRDDPTPRRSATTSGITLRNP